jgi:hypothetical protein
VFVASEVDGDGQPTHLYVAPTAGQHVAESDAEWARARLNEAATRTRVVTTVTELDALVEEAVIRDSKRVVFERWNRWEAVGGAPVDPVLPARVLYEPEETL